MLAAGSRFPDRALHDPQGASQRLAQGWARGKALVVVGHAGCGTTRLALPFVDRLHARRGPGSAVLAVLQEDAAGARALVASLGLSLPIGLDEDPYPLSSELGMEIVPALFLVGADGRLLRATEGFSRDDLEAFADELGVAGPLFGPDEQTPRFRPG